MKIFFLFLLLIPCTCLNTVHADPLEPYTYRENFEDRELGAWASYPFWQDLAYDQNLRVNEILRGDANISLVQKVTPYTNVDNYAGFQKLLSMYLVPGSKLIFRYYLKTNLQAESFKVRFAAGSLGKIDVTLSRPAVNKWVWVTVSYNDFLRENPALKGKKNIEVFALALLAKIPDADPAMPIYLGLDDIMINGAHSIPFRFAEPFMDKLPEFIQYIPQKHYHNGDTLKLSGSWPVKADKVLLEIFPFTDSSKSIFKNELIKRNELWSLKSLRLLFPDGLYIGRLSAFNGKAKITSTEFTIHLAPKNISGKHPRLLFDSVGKTLIEKRFKEDRFQSLYTDIQKNAKIQRTKIPVESLVYDLDQFPDEDWLPTWSTFGSHIYPTGEAMLTNAMSYSFHGDKEAGKYAKDVLIKLSEWPNWTHPWLTKRGKFSEHRSGSWSHRIAITYDLTYNLMTEAERAKIRKAVFKNIIQGVHDTYVYNDDIIGKTSNWIAITVGGSLMNMAAMFDDGPETENIEPYFTGAMIKLYTFLNRVADSTDGSWGEGYGYNTYSFLNLSNSIPSLANVFNIDVTAPLVGTYNEFIWAGIIKDKKWFQFGDSEGDLGSANNWAFLLSKKKTPRLGWFYNYLKKGETFDDILYDTKNVPVESPYDENPVKAFRKTGTTVFKSGWEKDDMVFVMRTGPFFNHQHLEQGSFWLADRGVTFIEERPLHNSNYYDDPLYQSHFIQPVAHSTILINKNNQSQRVGDEAEFAPGFNDHALIEQFLDGKDAAFSRGDIGRLYWDKIKYLSRNVIFIKPRVIIMLDEAVPGKQNADVTLLYQTEELNDIHPGKNSSEILKEGVTLHLLHLAPENVEVNAVETPHYLKTLQTVKPLKKEGMLTVNARTNGKPLIMANLLTTTKDGVKADVTSEKGNGFISGTASGKNYAFTTQPGKGYKVKNLETDALSIVWDGGRYFVAMCKSFRINGNLIIQSESPFTFEYSDEGIKYFHPTGGTLTMGARSIVVPKGEGLITIK